MFGGAASVSTSASAATAANAAASARASIPPQGILGAAGVQPHVSVRAPSVTIAVLLITQIQFLATLSLVDSTGAEDSLLAELTRNLRWVNLWPPGRVGRAFSSSGERLLQQDGLRACGIEPASVSDIGALVFLGNIGLFTSLLLGIVVLHIVLASAVEAYWLSKQRAMEELTKAQRRGIPIRGLGARRASRVAHCPDAESDPDELAASASNDGAISRAYAADSVDVDVDFEEDGLPIRSRPKGVRAMLADCRYRSCSVWLYFPHIELLFLLFAFEGAIASQLATMRGGGCPWVFYMACTSLVVYPVLMVILSYRTHRVRVAPDTLIVFKPAGEDENDGADGTVPSSFLSKVRTSLKEDHSMLAWANTGAWETVEAADEETVREGDQFRIGFEPLFVDFTKKTSWFTVYFLLEMVGIACAAVLVDDSVVQLFLFCGLHSLSFLLLVIFRPFANSVINAMGACLTLIDAACMAMLADTALRWQRTPRAKRTDTAVVVLQLVALVALIIPMYIDSSTVILGAIRQKIQNLTKSNTCDDRRTEEEAKEERKFIRGYIFRAWGPTWCRMLGGNVFACVADTTRGIRRVNTSAARTGPQRDANNPTVNTAAR
ncbi:unnamed protein product [Ectocarpus fasciculatus]